MPKKIGNLLLGLLMLSIVWNSVDILLRRWWWGQIPTQIGALSVYAILFSNLVLFYYFVGRAKRSNGCVALSSRSA